VIEQIDVAVIGTGWCGGIRAEALSRHPLVDKLHIAETREERLAEMSRLPAVATLTRDYLDILEKKEVKAVYICATPETTHYPMARDALVAGKHVFLEKPIAIDLWEADELITLARRANLKFTIGYSQRFNPKYAYAKKKLADGTLGEPVSALVSRHLSRSLGKKISGRVKLSPASMEATHDLDFLLWLLEPAKPVCVRSGRQPCDVSDDRRVRLHVDYGHARQRRGDRRRRRLDPAAGLPEFFDHLGRDHRQRRRADPR